MLTSDRRRDHAGRYAVQQRCDCCSQPIHGEHGTDDEVCAGGDGPGFFLCRRPRCGARYIDRAVEERRAIFAAGRAKSEATERRGSGDAECGICRERFWSADSIVADAPICKRHNKAGRPAKERR